MTKLASVARRCVTIAALITLSALAPATAEAAGRKVSLAVTTVDGRELDMESLRGKVVVVNFWATWCGPCLAEMPALEALYQRYHDKGLELIAVSVDRPSARDRVKKVASRYHFPVAMASDATKNSFGVPTGVPVTFVMDAEGIGRHQLIMEEPSAIQQAIVPLLAKAKAAAAAAKPETEVR